MAPKRTAHGRSPSPKRAKKDKQVGEKVNVVIEAIKDKEQGGMIDMPDICRQMLATAVPTAVGDACAKDERHAFQTKLADAIGDLLNQVVKTWESNVEDAKKHVESMEAVKAEKASALQAAETAVEQKSKAVTDAEAALKAAETALKDATANYEKAYTDMETIDIQKAKKEQQQSKSKTILTENFQPLKANEFENEEAYKKAEKKLLGALTSYLGKLNADGSLLSAMPAALEKKPAERGGFDAMVVDKLEETLKSNLKELDDYLANFDSIKNGKTNAMAEAQLAKEAAEEKEKSCKAALHDAKDDLHSGKTDVKNAKAAVADQEKQLSEAKKTEGHKEQALGNANENLAAFKYLYEREQAAPEPAAEAAAPAPEA